ncbi:hypothetical protein [Rhodococcoides yunnanense]|uniref:hypothetical protein n=1 Tax=Rhodococcoides yunnanense TaxID=278209 RepID=UPI000932B99A|nr:hypothetical protein [Rhodococcus yunnanensis]
MGAVAAVEPIFPNRLTSSILERTPRGERAIVVVDGADAADPVEFAVRLRDRAAAEGRSATVVDLHDYVRPASLRFEYSRTDELSYRTAWFDFDALDREVVAPMRAGGRGSFLPRLWDEASDRSARSRLVEAAPDHLLVLAGPTLLGRVDSAAVVVHLLLSEGALRRRTSESDRWTVEPLMQYYRDSTAEPDITVRWDHPDRPAVVTPSVSRAAYR